MKDTKIAIGMPTTGYIKYQTVFALIRLLRNLPFPHAMSFRQGSLIHRAREQIVEDAIKGDCTHVLFIDSDMTFEEDSVVRLLKRKKEIISAECNLKKLPTESTARYKEPKPEKGKDLVSVAGVGTGFLLIDLEVFKKISKPWFFFEKDLGEDYWFCERAKEAGYEIWVDRSVKIGHVGDFIY